MSFERVLVVAEHREEVVSNETFEAIGAARSLVAGLGGHLAVIVVGGTEETANSVNLDGVDVILHANGAPPSFDPAVYEAVTRAAVEHHKPRVVLVPHSVSGMGYAPALAAVLGAGLATDVFGLATEGTNVIATRSAYGGKVAMDVVFPERSLAVVTLRGASFPAPTEIGSAILEALSYDTPDPSEITEHIDYVHQPKGGVDIASADVIVSIGRGMGDKDVVERFAEFADRIGATLGCSRPIVDAGWLTKPHQVGQSGSVAKACSIYLSFGISGAIQHQFGMKHVDRIIAVNTDLNAPIFDIADFGTTVDAVELVDALLAEVAAGE